jgi:hypothetical protein
MSVPPPGGNGTTMRSGPLGKFCAYAGAAHIAMAIGNSAFLVNTGLSS